MPKKTPVVYVWSSSDQEKYKKYTDAASWLLAPMILLGLLILVVTIWGFIEFRDCCWKVAPPTVSLPVLISFFILSIIILLLSIYGLYVFNKERRKSLQQMSLFIRFTTMFLVGSVILMISLWIYTIYKPDTRFTRFQIQLHSTCFKDVAECWDSIHETHSCCGWNSPKDWDTIPHSCCDQFINYGKEICEKSKTDKGIPIEAAYQEGCKHHLYSRSLIYIILASVCWIFSLILLLAVLFLAIHLLRGLEIKKKLNPIIG